jgi:5,5'-dehydrodivanillate O-demethylase
MRKSGAYDKVVALGEEILAGRLRLNSPEVVVEPALTVNLQDYIAQRGQGVIADRRHEQLGQSDRVVILLRKLWSREMGKLANGGPLKRWSWPGYLETTSGGKSV